MILGMIALNTATTVSAQTSDEPAKGNPFDIAILIDNRADFDKPAAKADVDKLFQMFDQHMFIDKIVILERPTINVVCDVFGCPDHPRFPSPFPPLIWQIARQKEARLLVYYLGPGRIEGTERQLLFKRTETSAPSDVQPFGVGWLHQKLADAEPKSATLMLDTGFAPRPLPCANDRPFLISDALLNVRLNFESVIDRQRIPSGHVELSGTTPVQVPHCDRIDLTTEDVERPLFSKFLLKGIVDGEADSPPFGDEDHLIDLLEIGRYLDDRLKHAARFQWGRLQNVRAVGPERVLAAVDKRKLSEINAEVFNRRNPNAVANKTSSDNNKDAAGEETDDPDIIVTTTPPTQPPPPNGPTGACRFVVNTFAPAATALFEIFGGDRMSSCDWTNETKEPQYKPVEQILIPVAWRLGRSNAQETVSCLLDCRGLALPTPSADPIQPVDEVQPADEAQPVEQATEEQPASTSVSPTTATPIVRSAFNLEVCDRLKDEPLPFYIGLPRWMPGTYLISEWLRDYLGCPLPIRQTALPTPTMIAIGFPNGFGLPNDCGLNSVPAHHLDQLLANLPNYAVGIDIEIGGIKIENLDFKQIDDTQPRSAICIPQMEKPLPGPTIQLSTSEVRWLQSALTVDNRNPGPIDGKIGPKTLRALNAWQADNNRPETPLSPDMMTMPKKDFQEIIETFGMQFGQVQGIVSVF